MASVVPPTASTPPEYCSFSRAFGGASDNSARETTDLAPRAAQVALLLGTAADGCDLVPEAGEYGDRHRANSAGSSGDGDGQVRRLVQLETIAFERHDAEHRGEAGGADRHGPAGVETVGELDHPIGLDPGEVGEPAEVLLTQAEPGAHDLVARLDAFSCRGRLDGAGEVDAADHRELPDDRTLAGDGEPVLVVEARVPDPDGHVLVGQVLRVELLEPAGEAVLLCGEYCADRTVGAHRLEIAPLVLASVRPSWLIGTTCGNDESGDPVKGGKTSAKVGKGM